jgi:hypothetical protein
MKAASVTRTYGEVSVSVGLNPAPPYVEINVWGDGRNARQELTLPEARALARDLADLLAAVDEL